MDLGIEVILKVFSKTGLQQVFEMAVPHIESDNAKRIYALRSTYLKHIDSVIRFLQGKDQTFARQLCTDDFLPKASRFEQLEELDWAFGTMGMQDKGRHLATLFLEDLSDFIVECVDPHFGFSRYAERLGRSANTFDELQNELDKPLTFIDEITLDILEERIQTHQPKLVCLSVPFPGNLYSAFRCGQMLKAKHPTIRIAMGGGFANTELRSIKDLRVFNYLDFICLDDGELPIELLSEHVLEGTSPPILKRTFLLQNGQVEYCNNTTQTDYKQQEVGTPDYRDLHLQEYISVIEVTNPMHSLWSDGRWLKLTMAHGCYWGKCTFCDISLDYIKLYEPIAAATLVDRMEQLIGQTGERGFHFVDEAAPPALMREVALEILRRDLTVTWWTNIRFEKAFSLDLCRLLKASGCVAVSGGLEVASDRLLKLIDKGVTVEQVARVCDHFTQAGIMTHAYLMYGYPTQTIQETIDSLEFVRQLFELGIIQSGFWHQFALTAHSPVGLNPEAFGVIPIQKEVLFAENDVEFEDKTGIDHGQFSFGLRKSLFNFMHGIGFEFPLQYWFEQDIPRSTVQKNLIRKSIKKATPETDSSRLKLIWLGGEVELSPLLAKQKKKNELVTLTFHNTDSVAEITLPNELATWLLNSLDAARPAHKKRMTLAQFQAAFETEFTGFDDFWNSEEMEDVKMCGLLMV